MTKQAAKALSSVWVYIIERGKPDTWYKVTRVRGGFIVAGTRGHGTYNITETGAGLACSCKGFEREQIEGLHFCRHLVAVALAQVLISEIRAEATDDQRAPTALSRRASVPMMVDFDPFCEAA